MISIIDYVVWTLAGLNILLISIIIIQIERVKYIKQKLADTLASFKKMRSDVQSDLIRLHKQIGQHHD